MNIKRNQKGFTLIEVVLVLAIGGLIFLLAFIAFQQVSTNRRDTQRRSDANRVLAELQNYKGDNNAYPADISTGGAAGASGILPAGAKGFIDSYLGGANFKNPNKTTYNVAVPSTTANAVPAQDVLTYKNGYKCNPTGLGIVAADSGNVAVQLGLEKGAVCRDDQ